MDLTSEDATVLYRMMSEFYVRNELSEDERSLFIRLCASFNLGRPVPHHGSGPDNQ